MARPSPLDWFALDGVLLLPTAAGRVLLDLAGGLMLALLALPLLISGIGWLGWRVIQSRMVTCEVCGIRTFSASSVTCPVCGSAFTGKESSLKDDSATNYSSAPASATTIDVTAEDIGSEK